MSEENKRLSILDELDQFNTAPAADSLMLGILQEEEAGRAPNRNQFSSADSQEEPSVTTEQEQEKVDPYLPLNTSIQEMDKKFDNRFSQLERQFTGFAQQVNNQPVRQQAQPDYNYDPDMPITGKEMQALAHRQDVAHQWALAAYQENITTRAHLELQRFQQANPDFKFDPNQIDYAVNQMIRDGRHEQLKGVNWRGHFEQMYAPQREQSYRDQLKELETLRKENETLKKQHATRPTQHQPVSPATGRSSRGPAIASPVNQSQDDAVVNLKSFRQKGNFRGFAKDLPGILNQGR